MFKGFALDYYYSNIAISTFVRKIDQVYNSNKNYFKRSKYKRNTLFKWNKLTLKSIFSKKEGKQIKEFLKKHIDKL